MNPYRRTRMAKRGENIVGKGKSSSNDSFSLSFSELVYVHNDRESNLFIVLSTMDFSFLQSDGSNNNCLQKNLILFHWFLISSDGRKRINVSINSESAHTFVLSELLHRCDIPVSKWTEISEIRSCLSTYSWWIHIPIPESSFLSHASSSSHSPQHHITSEIISLIRNLLPIIIVSVHTGAHSSGLKDHNFNLSDFSR